MNKKILTKVLSFVLVICMLVPIIPSIGLDFGGVTAEAAMPTHSTTTVLFKTGSNHYWNGSKQTLDAADGKPVYNAGTYYISVSALSKAGATGATASAEFGGIDYVALQSGAKIPGTSKYAWISSLGFIAVTSSTSDLFSGVTQAEQISWIKANVFDHGSNNDNVFTADTGHVASKSHPYLIADQAEFDYLNSVYNDSGLDETLHGYLEYLVRQAESAYNTYSTRDTTDGALNSLYAKDGDKDLSVMPYADNNGYDGGGRQSDSSSYASIIERLAYGYQITRDMKYAKLALNMALALGSWEHWGAGHFLNAADASYHMALAYDWCYNAWGEISTESRDAVRDALFTKGVIAGIYNSVGNQKYKYYEGMSQKEATYVVAAWYDKAFGNGEGGIYNTRKNNWNGVCSSGMIMASLALVGETGNITNLKITAINGSGTRTETTIFNDDYFKVTYKSSWLGGTGTYKLSQALSANGASNLTTYQQACVWLINNNIKNLETYGLDVYAPDGSYLESSSYWSYGTNSIFRAIACLTASCGTDFGLSATMGFDKTAYFADYAQSPDGISWRYHDDNSSSVDTSLNALYGMIIGDETIVGYRKYLIEVGVKYPTVYDTFRYDASVTGFTKSNLDYYMEGIDGYTMRSSWEKGAAYIAFGGGDNGGNGSTHVQMDSGAFVYHNNGTAWFQDIGTEDYNTRHSDGDNGGYGYGTKEKDFSFYGPSAEGNNTLVTTKLKYGQNHKGAGNIVDHASNIYGGYAIMDQSSVYSGAASSAKRGILMTNDRKTTVIQDEVTFSSSQTAYWFGHMPDSITITISEDGKTAFLSDGKSTMRCTLVSDNASLKFTEMDCAYSSTNMVLNGTDKTGTLSTNKGGVAQTTYDNWHKLAVKAENVTSLKLAIVIEEVAVGDNFECGYTWTDMGNWSTALKADSNNYDDKLLLSKDFDIDGVGSFSSKAGNLRIANTLVDGDNAMGAYFVSGNTSASNITLAAAPGKTAHASIGNGMLVTEFDIKTLTTLPDVNFAIYGTDIYPIVEFSADKLGTPANWTHVTIVVDEESDMFYVYAGNTCVVKESFISSSYENLKLVIYTKEGEISEGTLLIDDVTMRTFTEKYTELDGILGSSNVGSNAGILDTWSDTTVDIEAEHTGAVAKIYVKEIDAPGADDDTPIVDFWALAGAPVSDTEAGAEVIDYEGVEVMSFAELETYINSGNYTNVDLYVGNTTTINISKRIVVDTNGYNFYALSDNLICQVSGEIYTYKAGSIRVALIINGSTSYVTYTNTQALSYNAPANAIGILKGVDNGDGSFNYVMTAQDTWAKTEYGEPLYGNDLIVTSENSKFYLTGNPYSGIFITVQGSTVQGYSDPNDFPNVLKSSTSFDKIVITNDFMISNTNGKNDESNTVTGVKNIYLNGHIINYVNGDTSDHFFALGSNAVLNVYGPGGFDMDAVNSNLIMKSGYSATPSTFNDITITAQHTLSDIRKGTVEFNNCDVTMENNRTMFSVTNRSDDSTPGTNTDNGTVNEEWIGRIVLNGGKFTNRVATGNTAIVQVKDNSRVVVTGGAILDIPGSYAAIYFEHANTDFGNASDKTGVDYVYMYLGEHYSNAKHLWSYTNVSGETNVDIANKIYLAEGVASSSANISLSIKGYNIDTKATTTSTITQIAPDHVIANTGTPGYAYKVVKTENAASVVWRNGDKKTSAEYWVAGSTPIANATAKSYLGSASEGKKYTYDLSALAGVGVVGGSSYTFDAKQMTDLELRIGMDLYSDFYVNIYVEVQEGVTYNYFMINGERYNIANCDVVAIPDVDGRFYKIVIKNVAPKDAAELIVVSVNVNSGEEITAVTSVLKYAEKVMTGSQGEVAKKLMYSIVDYIGAAAQYAGDRYTKASCDEFLSNKSSYSTDINITAQIPEENPAKDAIKSVYLDLVAAPTYAFRFKSTFTGEVTISYTNVKGENVSVTVNVEGGNIAGTDNSIYMLSIKAFDMASDITISTTEGSYVYNLDIYYTQAVSAQDALYDLVFALKSYCSNAQTYMAQAE